MGRINVPNTPRTTDEGAWLRDVAIGPAGCQVVATGRVRNYNWIGSVESYPAMMRYDGVGWAFFRPPGELLQAGNAVSDVAFSAAGDLWLTGIASNGARFARLSGTRWDLVDGADPRRGPVPRRQR